MRMECDLIVKDCNECMKDSPYPFYCKAECGEHEYCRGCTWPNINAYRKAISNSDKDVEQLKATNTLLEAQIKELSALVKSKDEEIASLTSHIKYLEDSITNIVEEDNQSMLDVLKVIMEEEDNQTPSMHINTPSIIINIG